jgi:hypothetical protein
VLIGLAANSLFGLWWLDPTVALAIAAICVHEVARRGKASEQCGVCLVRRSDAELQATDRG